MWKRQTQMIHLDLLIEEDVGIIEGGLINLRYITVRVV